MASIHDPIPDRDPDRDGDDAADETTVSLAVTDTLDLHVFAPRDVAAVVRAYLDEACAQGLRRVRLIHGKGRGVQRRTVRTLLERDPRVVAYGDAPDAAAWGATVAELAADDAAADDRDDG
ncbi:MAG: Smr/MutS family protein [Acidobacteriota bacterium]